MGSKEGLSQSPLDEETKTKLLRVVFEARRRRAHHARKDPKRLDELNAIITNYREPLYTSLVSHGTGHDLLKEIREEVFPYRKPKEDVLSVSTSPITIFVGWDRGDSGYAERGREIGSLYKLILGVSLHVISETRLHVDPIQRIPLDVPIGWEVRTLQELGLKKQYRPKRMRS